MAPLTPKGALAAAEIAFYSPALCVGAFLLVRHGFSKKLGWLYIVLLSIVRLIGASCILYAITNNDDSTSLLETAAITSSIGTAPLLLALMGFLERINQGLRSNGKAVPDMAFRGIQLVAILALVLAIVGGTDEMSSDHTMSVVGKDLREAGSCLFLAIYFALAFLTVLCWKRISYLTKPEHKLLYAGLAALPFLLVRMAYTLTVAFSGQGSEFYYVDVSVWAEAFMQFAMEAVVVIIFVTAGLLTPKMVVQQQDVEILAGPDADRVKMMQQKRQQQQPERSQRSRSAWDYRPSKLIMDAVSGRK